jgi:hypothetical protein
MSFLLVSSAKHRAGIAQSVSRLGYRGVRVEFLGGERDCCPLHNAQTGSEGTGGCVPEGKAHSSLSSAEVKNDGAIPPPPIRLNGMCLID